MTNRRIVFDTNILVSAACFGSSFGKKAFIHAVNNDHDLLASDETLAELKEVLHREKFDRFAPRDERTNFFNDFKSVAEKIVITERVTDCRDPKDNMFLELAISGQADFIISRDDDLLVLNPFRGIQILDAEDFLKS